jgi:hypothetical protein
MKSIKHKFPNKKRKAEMSTELLIGLILVIIIAGIGLFLWSRNWDFFSSNTDCAAQGGECLPATVNEQPNCVIGKIYSGKCGDKEVCCLKKS